MFKRLFNEIYLKLYKYSKIIPVANLLSFSDNLFFSFEVLKKYIYLAKFTTKPAQYLRSIYADFSSFEIANKGR